MLVVEDDRELLTLLAELLTGEGYAVDVARDGQAGLHRALVDRYDLLLVDRGLPAVEGVDLVRRLRRRGVSSPVLLLTARGTVADRVEGLDAGAEDYLVKPFAVDELLARVRALLRRHHDDAEQLALGSDPGCRRLDVGAHQVVGGPEPVDLSPREAALLAHLARHPQQVLTRDELLTAVFDDAEMPGSVDTYVHYLRRKLGDDVVRTVRGVGYRLGRA
ncbi:response regulator transcription factor [Angustibacter peucedani]